MNTTVASGDKYVKSTTFPKNLTVNYDQVICRHPQKQTGKI